jgi:two-component system sensor histidine kinase PilS (NtrC family)
MASPLPKPDTSKPKENPHDLLIGQLLWMIFLRVVLYTLLLGVSAYLQSGQYNRLVLPPIHLFFFILLIYSTSITSGLILLKSVDITPYRFGLKQILLDTLFVSILLYYSGGFHSIFTPIYFFPIIAGGLILPRLGGLIAAGAATLQYAMVLSLEYYRIFPDFLRVPYYDNGREPLAVFNLFAVYGLTFFLAATLSSLFAGRLRKTEDALSDSVRDFDRLSLLYKQIFDDISTGIITTDDNNSITTMNQAASQITGYSLKELENTNFAKIFPNISFTDSGTRHSAELQCNDGRTTRIGYSYSRLQYQQPKSNARKGMEECNNCRVITIQDISEVERLEKKMQQSEKLAAIGRMSAGIAHDFRNPLTAISGSAQVLSNELSQNDSSQHQSNKDLLTIILRESSRLSNTVSDFLKFARPEHAESDWFSFNRCLNEVIEVAQAAPSWPNKCTLDIRTEEVVDIWADQYQLFTILNHLLQNALAFTPLDDEKIRIEACEREDALGEASIQITVEDNGPGIPPGREEKIFEPFYTRRVDGTGLGLAIVKQMISEHDGSITVTSSSLLGGAKFTVNFPLP